MSTVAEEYGLDNLDNLEEGKSIGIDNWFPSKKQAEIELRYDNSLVKIFHDREDKTVREIAVEFDNIVSFQTIGKWIKEVRKTNNSELHWITLGDGRHIQIKSPVGKKVSSYKFSEDKINDPNVEDGEIVLDVDFKGLGGLGKLKDKT
ncbi:MAG: hypothetical protein OEZ01_18180, partial [Candidatus Heimdallarchaeota archaeon]|nr:hypothetical protein [Candidatus Heimdallarchaeota archaeon]